MNASTNKISDQDAGHEDTSVREVNWTPGTAGGGGEEGGAREIEAREGTGSDGGGVRRLCWDEGFLVVENADERRRVEGVVAAQEGMGGDDAAEGGAGGGGEGEVFGSGEAEEDFLEQHI